MIAYVKTLWQDFVFLFYPRVCVHCLDVLVKNEQYLCLKCRSNLPFTNYHQNKQNNLQQSFSFLNTLGLCSSYLKFNKKGVAQSILHQLKYRNNYDIGVYAGHWFGEQLLQTEIAKADVIIPVPLHKKKQKKRGYNQSQAIAEGISSSLAIPVDDKICERKLYFASQTKKGKMDRWSSLRSAYRIKNSEKVKGKRIILVDDVITTGATIGYLAELLEAHGAIKIHLLSLATGK